MKPTITTSRKILRALPLLLVSTISFGAFGKGAGVASNNAANSTASDSASNAADDTANDTATNPATDTSGSQGQSTSGTSGTGTSGTSAPAPTTTLPTTPNQPPATPNGSAAPSSTGDLGQQSTFQQAEAPTVMIEFTADSADLKQQDKDTISQALAGKLDHADEVRIAVWSDKTWPAASKDAKYTKDDQKLADKRADALKQQVQQAAPKAKINVYKMVDEGQQLAKDLKTDRQELQSLFAKKGDPSKAPAEGQMLSDLGGPSRAVIYVKMKDAKK